MTKIYLKYTWDILQIYSKITLRFIRDIPGMYQRDAWDMPDEIYQRHVRDMADVNLRYTCNIPKIYLIWWDVSKIYLRHTWNMPEIHLRYTWRSPWISLRYNQICVRYIWDIPLIYLKYTWDISEIYLRYT